MRTSPSDDSSPPSNASKALIKPNCSLSDETRTVSSPPCPLIIRGPERDFTLTSSSSPPRFIMWMASDVLSTVIESTPLPKLKVITSIPSKSMPVNGPSD